MKNNLKCFLPKGFCEIKRGTLKKARIISTKSQKNKFALQTHVLNTESGTILTETQRREKTSHSVIRPKNSQLWKRILSPRKNAQPSYML